MFELTDCVLTNGYERSVRTNGRKEKTYVVKKLFQNGNKHMSRNEEYVSYNNAVNAFMTALNCISIEY